MQLRPWNALIYYKLVSQKNSRYTAHLQYSGIQNLSHRNSRYNPFLAILDRRSVLVHPPTPPYLKSCSQLFQQEVDENLLLALFTIYVFESAQAWAVKFTFWFFIGMFPGTWPILFIHTPAAS